MEQGRAFVFVAFQIESFLAPKWIDYSFELGWVVSHFFSEFIHGLAGGSVKSHAVAIPMGIDFEKESCRVFPILDGTLEHEPHIAAIGALSREKRMSLWIRLMVLFTAGLTSRSESKARKKSDRSVTSFLRGFKTWFS